MKLAVMQPYFFPYIGYFQLVNAVDKFVFYDDVNYVNRGWINRNRILINGKVHYLTVHLEGASQNRLIKDIKVFDNRVKLKKMLLNAYAKAPYFTQVWDMIQDVLDYNTDCISELAAYSVLQTANFLGLSTTFEFSSEKYPQTSDLKSADRLMAICKINSATEYINPIGGQALYNKMEFKKREINLNFIKMHDFEYKQLGPSMFIPNLSIIDVLMFNSRDDIIFFLNQYELI